VHRCSHSCSRGGKGGESHLRGLLQKPSTAQSLHPCAPKDRSLLTQGATWRNSCGCGRLLALGQSWEQDGIGRSQMECTTGNGAYGLVSRGPSNARSPRRRPNTISTLVTVSRLSLLPCRRSTLASTSPNSLLAVRAPLIGLRPPVRWGKSVRRGRSEPTAIPLRLSLSTTTGRHFGQPLTDDSSRDGGSNEH
jgi:hypothetical protein